MQTAAFPTALIAAAQPPAQVWRVAGAAALGVSHKRTGLPCQDAQDFRVLADGTLLVALADGAGSAVFSEQGARRAVEAALNALAEGWESDPSKHGDPSLRGAPSRDEPGFFNGIEGLIHLEQILRGAFAEAREAVLRLAESGEDGSGSARDYATTLTCAIVISECLAVGQVGDGAVVALGGPDELLAVTRLQRGEYANETHFLVEEDALDQLTIDVLDRPVNGLAVMSDGLIRLALHMPSQEPHVPFFQPLFRFADTIQDPADASAQLAAFLDSERVNARTDDDKSLVLAVRVNAVPHDSPYPGGTARGEPSARGEPPARNEEDE